MTAARFQILQGVSTSWVPLTYRGRAHVSSFPHPVAWRLLGSNNRECGRSAQLFSDTLSCLGAVIDLRGSVETLEAGLVATLGAGLWTWRVGPDIDPVAVSPRVYHRRREAQRSLEVATENILAARMPPEVVRLRRRTLSADRPAMRSVSDQIITLPDGAPDPVSQDDCVPTSP